MDDDGDTILDVNENAGCSLLADCDDGGPTTRTVPLNSAEWDDTDSDAPTAWTELATETTATLVSDARANVDTTATECRHNSQRLHDNARP